VTGGRFHEPVLRDEAVASLVWNPGGTFVDGTTGGGGHAEKICGVLRGPGRLICIDADADALAVAQERLRNCRERVSFVQANFGALRETLASAGVDRIHGLLLDLGVSSHQLDEVRRGFSFRGDAPLDMRFDQRSGRGAFELLSETDGETLERILRQYGEEHAARRIARAIIARRPIRTTRDLADAVASAVGARFLTKSLARVFQAIRIEVNHELDNLQRVLEHGRDLLVPGGRLVVLSYHSLEDRIVKDFFKAEAARVIPSGHPLVPDTIRTPGLTIVTRKPVVPSDAERRVNPRARSARMRVAERTGGA
jgi:16S rRNA (cytosine1402-N4)-methyltransferase